MLLMFVLLIFVVQIAFQMDLEDFVISHEIIDKINSDPTSTWTAGVNKVFDGKRYRDIRHLFENRTNIAFKESGVSRNGEVNDLPTHYDVYEQFPECKLPIRDMGQCGALPRFGAVEVLSDRICVLTKGKEKVVLSPQISCDSSGYGCQGAYITRTWDYIMNTGVVTESCFPYASSEGHVPPCPYKCVNGDNWNNTKHKIKSYRHLKDDQDAMEDMLKYGSFMAFFNGYQDFFSYKSGVYQHKWGSMGGEWLVKTQGWGVDSVSGLDYWNVALGIGTEFGMQGYAWIWRGHDECGFEDLMYSPIPDL